MLLQTSLAAWPSWVFVGLVIALGALALLMVYRFNRLLPDPALRSQPAPEQTRPASTDSVARIPLQHNWDRRPRYETLEHGLFVGREALLERLTGDLVERSCGTVLISGVRGVGKTALVERALIAAHDKLRNRYWRLLLPELAAARFPRSLDAFVHRALLRPASARPAADYLTAAAAAENTHPRRWLDGLNPIIARICKLNELSGAQLLVLKFNASDISGALADPQPAPDPKRPAKPQVNPEKLLRALIRKLYFTCHPSQGAPEAQILERNLRDSSQRTRFFDRLAGAYQKSISKSYRETISDSLKEALRESRSSAWELKANVERILGAFAFLALLGVAIWAGVYLAALQTTQKYLISGTAGIAAFVSLGWTVKRSREQTRDSDRQFQFSYEFDYSLAQMETDLREILNVLHVASDAPFDRNRCYTRVVAIFDELDKLENPIEQLNNVITHFKNFFTLSDALFVFITDHQFYEHLGIEAAKAQRLRQYTPEHTFFNNRIYLRKPEFEHFYQVLFTSCERSALIASVTMPAGKGLGTDPQLVDYLLRGDPDVLPHFRSAPLPALTYLMANRSRFSPAEQSSIDDMFTASGGYSNPFALATLWAGAVGTDREAQFRQNFEQVDGWSHADSVALLYHHRFRFSETDRPVIERHYDQAKSPSLRRYTSVDGGPFTLTDLARALCFQSRNHYFDLFFLIHDYVASYEGGVPILHVVDTRFTREQRLWSRYQQMVEAAFRYRREDHPSREYWNAQLLETLYNVFDTRSQGDQVLVGSLAYSPAPVDGGINGQPPAGQANGAITQRDIDHINEAVLRLLRLLLARGAVRVEPALAGMLKNPELKLDAIKDKQIFWQPDCESEITQEGIGIEPYEQELIDFWDTNRIDLESIDAQLQNLWKLSACPEASHAAVLRNAVQALRSKADGLRARSTTISHPDANALRSHFVDLENFAHRVPELLTERVLADEDTLILPAAALRELPSDPEFRTALVGRHREAEDAAKLPLRFILFPRPSQAMAYLVGGAASGEVPPLGQLLEPNSFLFWYARGPERSEPAPVPNVASYHPTRAAEYLSDLFVEYSRFAAKARTAHLAETARGRHFKDRTSNLALAGEVLKPSEDPADVMTQFTQPAVAVAAAGLSELAARIPTQGVESLYSQYRAKSETPWKAELFVDSAVAQMAPRFASLKPSLDLVQILKTAILETAPETARGAPDSFGRALTSPPDALVRAFFKSLLKELISARLAASVPNDPSLTAAVSSDAVDWFLNTLADICKPMQLDLSTAPAKITLWSAAFETGRRTLKPPAPPLANAMAS